MLLTSNTTATSITTAGGVVPIGDTVYNTNPRIIGVNEDENAIEFYQAGTYSVDLMATILAGSADATVTIKQYNDGTEVDGASATVDIPTTEYGQIVIPYAVQVKNAESGVATVGWEITTDGACTITSSNVRVSRYA